MSRINCLDECSLNTSNISLKSLKDLGKETTITEFDNKTLEFTPVGNSPLNPVVIICGKVPDNNTWIRFLSLYRSGLDTESAAFKTVYSNMRENMYRSFSKINLFELLEKLVPYWKIDDRKNLWDNIFYDEISSKACGIQMTQACDCAILNSNSRKSKQPSKGTMNKINSHCPNCLFNSFIVTSSLKLIIFLDTPSNDSQFHQQDFFENSKVGSTCRRQGVKVISIPHPSGANPVNNNLERLEELKDKNKRYVRAYLLFEDAKKIIKEIVDKY